MVNDFVQTVDGLKADIRDFLISPNRWRTSRVQGPLSWCTVKFEAGNQSQIPLQRGIYAFTVMHANDHFPPHGYIMYIGITGEEALHRTLNDRFYEYLKEQRRNKRPKVHYMLAKYSDDLFFNYVPIADDTFDLGQLEADLNDAIIPPVVEKDFSAEVRAVVKAFRS